VPSFEFASYPWSAKLGPKIRQVHSPATVLKKTWRPGAARYAVPVRRAFEVKYSESMRDPGLAEERRGRPAPALTWIVLAVPNAEFADLEEKFGRKIMHRMINY
jgi:hypothetical protein